MIQKHGKVTIEENGIIIENWVTDSLGPNLMEYALVWAYKELKKAIEDNKIEVGE